MAANRVLEDLLGGISRRETPALDAFYTHTADTLYGVALRILGSKADADDTLQDAFIAIWNSAGGFRPGVGSALAWAIRITRNRALDRLRARRRDTAGAENLELHRERNGDSASPHPATNGERDARAKITGALAALSDGERTVIEMAFFEGRNHAEIATALGCPSGTIKARIRRGMAKLRAPLVHLRTEVLER